MSESQETDDDADGAALEDADLGALGESILATWAHQVGISPNKAEHDKKGWDFFLSLPRPRAVVAATSALDRLPCELSCLVQVKATRNVSRAIGVRLSNLERLVKWPIPAFFVVLGINNKRECSEAVVIHVGKEMVGAVLERLRRLPDSERDRLHKHDMMLKWSTEDTLPELNGLSLLARIRAAIGADVQDYVRQKQEWIDTVGYEDRPYRVTMTHPGMPREAAYEAFADFAIGLRKELPIESFLTREVRFGLEKPIEVRQKPLSSTIRFEPVPSIGRATLEVLDAESGEIATIECSLHSAAAVFPFLPEEHHKSRFVSEAASIVVQPPTADGKDPVFSFQFDFGGLGTRMGLEEAARSARFFRVVTQSGEPRLTITFPDAGKASFPSSTFERDSVAEFPIGRAIESAWRIATELGVPVDGVTIESIDEQAKTLELVDKLLRPADATFNVRAKVEANDVEREAARAAILYLSELTIGKYVVIVLTALTGTPIWHDVEGRPLELEIVDALPRVMGRRVTSDTDFDWVDIVGMCTVAKKELAEGGIGFIKLPAVPEGEHGAATVD